MFHHIKNNVSITEEGTLFPYQQSHSHTNNHIPMSQQSHSNTNNHNPIPVVTFPYQQSHSHTSSHIPVVTYHTSSHIPVVTFPYQQSHSHVPIVIFQYQQSHSHTSSFVPIPCSSLILILVVTFSCHHYRDTKSHEEPHLPFAYYQL